MVFNVADDEVDHVKSAVEKSLRDDESGDTARQAEDTEARDE